MNDDSELLRRFVQDSSESAFAELVRRMTPLVYSAALRQVGGDHALAAEVCQSVFVDLARKARSLVDRPVLASWLFTSTRFSALKALRTRRRRLIREQEAHAMEAIGKDSLGAADWEKTRAFLDRALCDLPEHDRVPILMRYFEGQPYAAMGESLGISENSARMRAERALEKLRLSLTARGVTSTAAALGLALTTNAVAAPPAGLAATLASTALAKSAAIGSGGLVGWLAKFSPFTALNKAPTSYAAFATIGAATVVSYEKGGSLESLSFKVYLICFGVGLIFTLLSAVTGHIFGGHGDGAADGHADGSFHGQGHAEAGGNAHDMPGFSPLSPTTIATFITAFGGFGMIMEQIPYLQSPWMSVPIASLGALGIAAMVFMFFRILFQRTQASSEGHVAQLIGLDATVITPIQPGAVGEIAYVQGGTRYSAPARSDASEWLLAGTTVKITRVVGTQFYVIALQPSAVAR